MFNELFTFATSCRLIIAAIILKHRKNRKYSISGISRLLIVLLAVFYVSIIAVEATHGHNNLMEKSSSDGINDDLGADDCKICAYFAHHEQAEAVISSSISFALFVPHDGALIKRDFTSAYQTTVQEFINRGPPYLFV